MNTPKTDAWQHSFDAALRKRDAGDLLGCLRDLDLLASENPDIAGIIGTRAGVQWELGLFVESAAGFQRATELSPKSEVASLGLFQSLRRLGRLEEAQGEMNRFLSIRESSEYREIQAEMKKAREGET